MYVHSRGVDRHRVIIVGSGFAGLLAARSLRRSPVEVTIVDRTNHHLFQPLLYQVATGILSEGDIAPPIRDILRRQSNAKVVLGEVVNIDPDGRTVTTKSMGPLLTLPYDSLILAAGATPSYFGHHEFATHAQSLKTIDDALELRGRIFGAFEMAELERDPERRREWLTFAIVGAGASGVELAGEIAELSRRALRRNFREIDPSEARIVLLDLADAALGAFPPRSRDYALKALTTLGVELRLGVEVTSVDELGLVLAGSGPLVERLEARTKIWAAGVRGAELGALLAARTGAQLDRAGRVKVDSDCTVPGHPEISVVGDLMALEDLPGVAEVAMQSGRHAAREITRRLNGHDTPTPFRYRDLGTTATIARFRAVAVIGPLELSGLLGWLTWLCVHLVFLTGFKNRASALVGWLVAFLGRGRPQRTITTQQVAARAALHQIEMNALDPSSRPRR